MSTLNTSTIRSSRPGTPITLLEVTDLKAALQALVPQAQREPLTEEEQVNADYEDYLDDRSARYGY